MPLFLSEEEFSRCSHDAALVAEKADAFIKDLYIQLETVKAESDASTITAEQTCSIIEQKYISLSTEFSSLQSLHSELSSSIEQRSSELAQLQSEKQQLLLQFIGKDGEIERLKRDAEELQKSKRELMELLEQKKLELSEKNANTKSYLDKIVYLTESVASKEARLGGIESELAQSHATSARYLQEKELLERHNTWLNEELTTKVDDVIRFRKANGELETDMSTKITDLEKKMKDSCSSLNFHKERVRELEAKLVSIEEELLSTKDAAATADEGFSEQIGTATKLGELYKESSEEWSKKAGELEGVIKALEVHLDQVENEFKDKLEKEMSSRKEEEKECAELKEKLQTCEVELENLKKQNELNHLPLSSFMTNSWTGFVDECEVVEDDRAIVPRIPAGVSGTALAASLLRDGWSLARLYVKYQEAVDALRHEQQGRKQAQAILERVLYEIEEKAGVIMEEREEHGKLLEAYSGLNQKLQDTLSEHSAFETTIQGLKASLKRQERDYAIAQKEIVDLQKQVSVLLKECRDVQLRCGSVVCGIDEEPGPVVLLNAQSNMENLISERLLTFKDINGLVEQNVRLRSIIRNLSYQIDQNEAKFKEKYEKEVQKHTDETTSKVNTVLQRAQEQGNMIESLHNSVAMYKRLYEEEHKLRSSYPHPRETLSEQGSKDIVLFHETNLEASNNVQHQASERVKNLEEDLAKSRSDIISLRAERDKLALEAQFALEKYARFMKDFEHQREEHNGVITRNVEFSQLIVDYQKKLREFSDSVYASEEHSRKLTMEVSTLKHEKDLLQNSEKRASDEIRSLSERLHRLQVSLNTIQSTEEVREEARSIERRKQEEYTKKIEREWAEAKRELQEERDNFRNLTLERDITLKNAQSQVEEMTKQLANALQSVGAAESRAAVSEARYSDMKKLIESARSKDSDAEGGLSSSSSERILANLQDEVDKWRGEAQACKDHMLQYKSISQVNEEALKQMESAHVNYRTEVDQIRSSLEAEVHSLRERVTELENECKLKTEEVRSANAGKEEALDGILSEISSLKDDCAVKTSQIVVMESQISALKEDLEKERQRCRAAQGNYERQVILQSETIQELTRTSQALASSQKEASELRKLVDVLKTENNELKSKWETEKLAIEVYKNEADKKYIEVNELNKVLHSQLEALHITFADKEMRKASGNSSQTIFEDDGMQNVVSYLRRSKEIAETEMSLLKQEKHRLQSQLENALKAAEAAQASINSERAKSRASIFTEEEFKSLQLQLRELNLLRESNIQLREENRCNFEECQKQREAFQKARTENENLEKLLRNREVQLETQLKEIEILKLEKLRCEKRIEELVEKCKEVDVDEYNRLKESYQQLQVNLREKDKELEDVKKLLSEKEKALSVLEQDFSRSRIELNDRETRINEILQSEASLKSEVEKFKRLTVQVRRRADNLTKEKDDLIKEMQSLSAQKDDLSKEMQSLSKLNNDLSKEMQSVSKQLEEARQVKINSADSATEQALREKEEKDAKIQILMKSLERNREDLRKEKEDNQKEKDKSQKLKKIVFESHTKVTKEKKQFSDELNKHQQALKWIQDEVEKLKNGNSQSEGTSLVQHIATTLLEDFASTYFQAVENFERVAQQASAEVESTNPLDASPLDNTQLGGAIAGQTATSLTPTSAAPPLNVSSTRTSDDRERKIAAARANVKTGRRLVRPSLTKPKEPQTDVQMQEADVSNTDSSSKNTQTQGNPMISTQSLVHKRSSVSFSSDLQGETLLPEEAGLDLPTPTLKKLKPSSILEESGEEPADAPVKLPETSETEVPLDNAGSLQVVSKDEIIDDVERDEGETAGEQGDEPTADEQIQDELQSVSCDIAEEKSDKPSETVPTDDQLRDQTEQDIQRIVTESGEREDGELDSDIVDDEGNGNISAEIGEDQVEQSVKPASSPRLEPLVPETLELGEIQDEEKNDDMDGVDLIAETDRASDSLNTSVVEASGSTSADIRASEQGDPTLAPDSGARPPSPVSSGSTIIDLQERARKRAEERQASMTSSSPSRGRGRVVRGRAVRGGRTGRTPRGQSPG